VPRPLPDPPRRPRHQAPSSSPTWRQHGDA
jgi:hypothetical protein